jgi:NAD(P)-dependent dehydrogenase (short-subunit alcohol dehydrogenase family)
LEPYGLDGKRVLVTGASSGIGYQLAQAFAAEGSELVLVARRRDRLEGLAERICALGGSRPLVVSADLSIRGEAARVAQEAVDALGAIEVLVNNAGGALGGSVWAVADRDEARADFEVDFWSPLALIGALVPDMRLRGEGAVVNVTSMRQVFGWPMFGHNTAAQAALALITETLRLELMPFGVHVIEVIPGPVDTPVQGPTKLIPGIVEAVHGRMGMAQPEEIAVLIVEAVRDRRDRVFCPEETTRALYENPIKLREEMVEDVKRMFSESPMPGEVIDHLVIGADDPMITQAREQWEADHATGVG